jgi:hypothetical protein
MIDIRYNIFLSWKKGIIDKETKQMMVNLAKRIYFPFRTSENIIKKSFHHFPSKEKYISKFSNYISINKVSLKELDTIYALQYISSLSQI